MHNSLGGPACFCNSSRSFLIKLAGENPCLTPWHDIMFQVFEHNYYCKKKGMHKNPVFWMLIRMDPNFWPDPEIVYILQKLTTRRNFRNKVRVCRIHAGSETGFGIIWKVESGSWSEKNHFGSTTLQSKDLPGQILTLIFVLLQESAMKKG